MDLSSLPADRKHVISDRLENRLRVFAGRLLPKLEELDRKFAARLRRFLFSDATRLLLAELSPGSLARMATDGASSAAIEEHVRSRVEKLAGSNLQTARAAQGLSEYVYHLRPVLRRLPEPEQAEILSTCDEVRLYVLLRLSETIEALRQAEAEIVTRFREIELNSNNLDGYYRAFIEKLTETWGGSAGHLFLLSEDLKHWVLKASTATAVSEMTERISRRKTLAKRKTVWKAIRIDSGKAGEEQLLDPGWRGAYPCFWILSLQNEKTLVGMAQVAFAHQAQLDARKKNLLAALAEEFLKSANRIRLIGEMTGRAESLRAVAGKMLQEEEAERRRMSCELHDNAGQSLVCIRLQMELIEQSLPPEAEEWRTRLAEARDLTEKTILDIRRLIADLSPAVLQQLGLAAAVRQVVNRFRQDYRVRARLHLGRLEKLPADFETVVYRLIQECCTRLGRFSSVSNVSISLSSSDALLRLSIEEDGSSFTLNNSGGPARPGSVSLQGISERVILLGGRIE
ncbi:MAG: sensor histidine kinase, partial [Bryobacteraceae bacterium]